MTMPLWQGEDVIRAVRGQCLHEQIWTASGVSINSRTLQKGDLFVAVKGESHDGHDYVAEALAAGASAAIVHRTPAGAPAGAPLIFVEDSFTALQDLGKVARARARARIGAVTGSVGKTGTKEQLRLMLGASGQTFANEGNLNNHWGVPLSLARLPEEASFAVFELGMNHAGEMAGLTRQVQPDVALITTIEAVHLEHFASTEAIADAKAEIFLGMRPDGVAVLNRDTPHFARLLAAARTQGLRRILSFGRDAKADARLVACVPRPDGGSDLSAIVHGQSITCYVAASGDHVAFNALGALLVADALGANLMAAAESLADYLPPAGRGARQTVTMPNGAFTLIDESYNASPVAVRAALAVLAETPVGPGGRRLVALGDMLELGPDGPRLHAGLAEAIQSLPIDAVYGCGPLMRHLRDALPADRRGLFTDDSESLAAQLAPIVHPGDAVMVKGSNGMRMKHVVAALVALSAEPNAAQKRAG